MNIRFTIISFFILLNCSLLAQGEELCPPVGLNVFGGSSENVVSWGEPLGNIGCADYAIDALPFTAQGSNAAAGDEWPVSGGSFQGEDVSYALNVSQATTYDFTLCSQNTDYDTKLEIFTNSADCLSPLSTGNYNDDATCEFNGLFSSLLGVTLQPGQYYVVVDGWNGGTGNYELSISESVVQNNLHHNGNTIKDAWPMEQEKMASIGLSQEEIDIISEEVISNYRFPGQDVSSNREIPEECGTFSTYRVYDATDNSILAETTSLVYTIEGLDNGTEYCYYVTTVYSEGESEPTNTECGTPELFVPLPPTNVYVEPWDEEVTIYWTDPEVENLGVPYFESFDFGGLLDLWLVDGGENWRLNELTGNEAPAFQFVWSPTTENYDQSLYSPPIPLGDLTEVTLSFDLEFDNYNATGLENLAVEYKTGSDLDWTVLEQWSNGATQEDFSFTNFSYLISELSGNLFVRFHCFGATTFDIDWWFVDNFSVTSPEGRQSRNEYDFLGYNVYVNGILDNDLTFDTTSYTAINLDNELQYTFGVTAVYEGANGEENYESEMVDVVSQPIYVFGDVTGIVNDINGDALDSVIVSSGNARDTTDSEGSYTLKNLDVGLNTVRARKSGFYTQTSDVEILAQAEPTVQDLQLSPDVPRPLGLKAVGGDSLANLSWNTPGDLDLYELFYDDGVHESSITGGSETIELAVFFNPNVSGQVYQAKFMFTDIDGFGFANDPVEVRLYTASQTGPPELVYTSQEYFEVSDLDVWLDYDFSTPVPINENGFYLGYRFTAETGPGTARDETGYIVDHSFVNFGDNLWIETGALGFPGNFMMRAVAALEGDPEATEERNLTVLSGGNQISNIVDYESTGDFQYTEESIFIQPNLIIEDLVREDVINEYRVYSLDSNGDEVLQITTTDTFTTLSPLSNYQEYCYQVRAVWDTENYGVLESRPSNTSCTVPFKPGDVDFNNVTDINDVLAVVDFILEVDYPTEDELRNVDINMDEEINISDVVMMVDIIFGVAGRSLNYNENTIAFIDLSIDKPNTSLMIDIDYDAPIRAIELELDFDNKVVEILQAPRLAKMQDNVLIASNIVENGIMKIVVADLYGSSIESNERSYVNIPIKFIGSKYDVGSVNIGNIIIAGLDGSSVEYVVRSSMLDIKPIPSKFALLQNFPNPFNPSTEIRFDLAEPGFVDLAVYNMNGQMIRKLKAEDMTPGYHALIWDGLNDYGSRVSSGMYFYTIRSGQFHDTKKMLFMK